MIRKYQTTKNPFINISPFLMVSGNLPSNEKLRRKKKKIPFKSPQPFLSNLSLAPLAPLDQKQNCRENISS